MIVFVSFHYKATKHKWVSNYTHQQLWNKLRKNEVIALQNYKFILLRKKQMLVLKKEIKRKHLQQFDKKRKKNKFVITAGENGKGLGETLGSVRAFLEPSVALSISRPSSFAIPSSVPGAGTTFSRAWTRAVSDGNNLSWDKETDK